jgi:hypothetical protein
VGAGGRSGVPPAGARGELAQSCHPDAFRYGIILCVHDIDSTCPVLSSLMYPSVRCFCSSTGPIR